MLRQFLDRLKSSPRKGGASAPAVQSAQEAAERLIAQGKQAEGRGELRLACERYRAAASAAPQHAPAHLNLGIGLEAAGDIDGAMQSYEAAHRLAPSDAYASYNLGRLRYTKGAMAEAEALLLSALDRRPEFPEASITLAHLYCARNNPAGAATVLEAALRRRPDDIGSLRAYAMVLGTQGKWTEAESTLRHAVKAYPGDADAVSLLGGLFAGQGRWDEASRCYRNALDINPKSRDARLGLGEVFRQQGDTDEAIACFEKALESEPDSAEINTGLGNLLRERGRLTEAAACHQRAVALDPDDAAAQVKLGHTLWEVGRMEESSACYRKAIELRPDFAEAYSGLGNALVADQRRLDEAVDCYRQALALQPDYPEARYNLGNALTYQNRQEEALEQYRQVLALDPEHVQARWMLAIGQLPIVYGAGDDPGRHRAAFSAELDELDRWFDESRTARGHAAVGVHQPFYLAYQEENNRDLLERYGRLCSRLMGAWLAKEGVASPPPRERGATIRIGIASDFSGKESVWNAIVNGWFQELDSGQFEIHAFHLGLDQKGVLQGALSRAARLEQGARGLRQWVDAILGARLDVLIYPDVGMDPLTVRLASLRLVPVQAATWGHPETSGLPTIDYYFSAEDMEPPGAQANYSERLVALPHLGCFYRARQVDFVQVDTSDLNLESDAPLLISAGKSFKYMPQHDWIFAEIAKRLGRCRIVFFTPVAAEASDKFRERLEHGFSVHGLAMDRFVSFIPWQPRPVFYGLMRQADVFLDTIGFSGFNTAMAAVECGLPVVTREGRFLRGRFSSGILKRMGLDELVARSEEDYVALSVRLCRDDAYREDVRRRIGDKRHLLFEDTAPIRALEDFLVEATARAPVRTTMGA